MGAGSFGGEVIHVPMMALREPLFECGVMRGRVRSCNASEGESQLVGFVFDDLFEVVSHGFQKQTSRRFP